MQHLFIVLVNTLTGLHFYAANSISCAICGFHEKTIKL